jgi:hypothetical protein
MKGASFHDRVCFAIRNVTVFGNFYGAFAEVIDGFQFHLMRCELIDALSEHQ